MLNSLLLRLNLKKFAKIEIFSFPPKRILERLIMVEKGLFTG